MNSGRIRVVVHGVLGRMGREMATGLSREAGIEVLGGVDNVAASDRLTLADDISISLGKDLEAMLSEHPADVVVDFSTAEASMAAARAALGRRVNLVVGTTGLSQGNLDEIDALARQYGVGAVVASNFTIGAVLLMHLSRLCAKYFDYAEIIELHHEKKLDSPSGTALSTARAMEKSRGKPFIHPQVNRETLAGTRGGECGGISIHSVRMPGLLAHQEVVFGGLGQTLSLRHDTVGRDCYLPGVALAVREVSKRQGLTNGLDRLMGLVE